MTTDTNVEKETRHDEHELTDAEAAPYADPRKDYELPAELKQLMDGPRYSGRAIDIMEKALKLQVPTWVIEDIALLKFPDYTFEGFEDRKGASTFSWVRIMREQRESIYGDKDLKLLMQAVLNRRRTEREISAFPLRELLNAPSAYTLFTKEEFVDRIKRSVMADEGGIAMEVFERFWQLAHAIGVLNGASAADKDKIATCDTGKPDALRLAAYASKHLVWLASDDMVDTAMLLPHRLQFTLFDRMYEHALRSRKPLADSPQHVKFLVNLALSGHIFGDGDRVMKELMHSMTRYDQDEKDPDRAVRLYRWYLKEMRAAPSLPYAEWMDACKRTPEMVRAQDLEILDTALRKQLKEVAGYEIVEVERSEHQGRKQLTATVQNGNWTNIYIHRGDSSRGSEYITGGMQVIVPIRPNPALHQRLFARGPTTGYLAQLQPAAPPTSLMESDAQKRRKI